MKYAVTGAYGYSGKYITHRLLNEGHYVMTLTNSPDRQNPFGGLVKACPFSFENSDMLAKSLEGIDVLINTYWVRFNHSLFKQSDAVANTQTLFKAARMAGVRRIVHFSITNPSLDSPLEYFRSKAVLEQDLMDTGVSYAILRPAVLFGKEDILINNIAWTLRRLPVFGVFGDGQYKIQPIYVDDMAALAVEQSMGNENVIVDAIGPETFTFRELVSTIGKLIEKQRPVISMPPALCLLTTRVLGWLVNDVMLTKPEIEGLMGNLLYVVSQPTGKKCLTEWIQENRDSLGKRYANEVVRRIDRNTEYS